MKCYEINKLTDNDPTWPCNVSPLHAIKNRFHFSIALFLRVIVSINAIHRKASSSHRPQTEPSTRNNDPLTFLINHFPL